MYTRARRVSFSLFTSQFRLFFRRAAQTFFQYHNHTHFLASHKFVNNHSRGRCSARAIGMKLERKKKKKFCWNYVRKIIYWRWSAFPGMAPIAKAVKSCFLIKTTVEGNKAEICHTDSGTLKALLRNHRLIQFQSAGRDESETAKEIWYTATTSQLRENFPPFEYKFVVF